MVDTIRPKDDGPIIKVQGLSKCFVLHARGIALDILQDFNLTIHPGKITVLTGPSGVGKSSVLKCIYRTYLPCKGQVVYRTADGKQVDLASADEHTVLALRQQELGFVTQFLYCLPRQPAVDVVARPLVIQGTDRGTARVAAQRILAHLNIPEALFQLPPATFSGGEKQRVNLARGFLTRPRLLLLDEPTASLDKESQERVVELILQAKAEGAAILAIFHDPDLIERIADDRVEISPSVRAAPLTGASTQTNIDAGRS